MSIYVTNHNFNPETFNPDFDSIFTVKDDGTIEDGPGSLWAPDLLDGELEGSRWEFFSTGYSGQDRYSGPIMHASELFSGRLRSDVLSEPGTYVLVVSYYSPEDETEEIDADGWAVLKLR